MLAGIGWAVTGERMAGMDAGPGTDPGALGFFLVTWVVMMGAMMFPSTAPMVLVYDRLRVKRRELGKPTSQAGTALFVGGYLVSWAGFGLLGWALFEVLRGLSIDALGWDHAGRYVAGGVVLLAAVYELTPLKHACLRRCRSPFSFLFDTWKDGPLGALRLGLEHGAWCVGCCWALMAALFALGVMSIAWMAFVAAVIAAEKLLPWSKWASLSIAILLAVLGVSVALVPDRVPGLVQPDSVQADRAQMMMRGEGSGGGMKKDGMGGRKDDGAMPGKMAP